MTRINRRSSTVKPGSKYVNTLDPAYLTQSNYFLLCENNNNVWYNPTTNFGNPTWILLHSIGKHRSKCFMPNYLNWSCVSKKLSCLIYRKCIKITRFFTSFILQVFLTKFTLLKDFKILAHNQRLLLWLLLTSNFVWSQVMEDDLRALQWEHEVLEQRFEKIQSERDELYTKFVKVSSMNFSFSLV